MQNTAPDPNDYDALVNQPDDVDLDFFLGLDTPDPEDDEDGNEIEDWME